MSEAKYLKPATLRGFFHHRWPTGDEVRRICVAVAEAWDMAPEHILSSDRSKSFAQARHAAFFVARELTGRSWPELGKLFRRDHSSVIVGARKAEKRASEDERFARRLRAAREALGAA